MAYLPPVPPQVVAGNSTATPLATGAGFTGTSMDFTAVPDGSVYVESISDVGGTAFIQWSTDNSNWDRLTTVTAPAGLAARIASPIRTRYGRVLYQNGATAQGYLRLQTMLQPFPTSSSYKTVDTTIQGTDLAQAVKAVNIGKNPQGTYIPQAVDVYGNMGVFFSGGAADAFGRARTSNPQTLFNVSFQYDTQPLIMQTGVTGSGATAAKIANTSAVQLTTGGGTAGNACDFQSKGYYRYEPGKSLLILMTGIIGSAKANVRQQIGFFDANDGVFFDQNNGMGVTVRTSTSGGPVDTTVLQAHWNVDRMDGTGVSGVTLDFTKGQIFAIDLQWLGTGAVRFGFEVNGRLLICHQVNNANVNATIPYMNTAALPAHWAVRNTGAASGATTMTAVCCAVVSEGGADKPQSYEFSANTTFSSLLSVGTTLVPLISIRPKTTFNGLVNRSRILIQEVDIFDDSAQALFWQLIYNPTLGGATSFTDVNTAYSAAQVDVGSTTVSGGIVVASGYVEGGNKANSSVDLSHIKIPLTLNITGTVQDIWTLACQSNAGSVNTAGSVTWSEER